MARQEFATNLGLDVFPSTQDPDNSFDIHRLYNACKSLAASLDSATGAIARPEDEWSQLGPNSLRLQNLTRFYAIFSESVTPGQIVSIWNNAGVPTVRKAGGVGLAGGLARGYVVAAVTAGNYGEVFLGGANAMISGMIPGATYYLSATTAGSLVAAAPGAGSIQEIGFALSSSVLWFAPTGYAR